MRYFDPSGRTRLRPSRCLVLIGLVWSALFGRPCLVGLVWSALCGDGADGGDGGDGGEVAHLATRPPLPNIFRNEATSLVPATHKHISKSMSPMC